MDLKIVLGEHNFYATDRELSCLMERFDKDKDGRISFPEYSEEMMPKLGHKY
jgi:Ca2+-binding EF-hand superfamily protein